MVSSSMRFLSLNFPCVVFCPKVAKLKSAALVVKPQGQIESLIYTFKTLSPDLLGMLLPMSAQISVIACVKLVELPKFLQHKR